MVFAVVGYACTERLSAYVCMLPIRHSYKTVIALAALFLFLFAFITTRSPIQVEEEWWYWRVRVTQYW